MNIVLEFKSSRFLMFDKSLGPSFAKVYYQRYISDPTSLSSLYADNAVFSHGDVQQGMAGSNTLGNDSHGITKITEQLEMIKRKQKKSKVAILHIDMMPTGISSVTILVGGYFLYESGPTRFVQNFILKHTGIENNFIIVNDCLRQYEASSENSLFSQDKNLAFQAEGSSKASDRSVHAAHDESTEEQLNASSDKIEADEKADAYKKMHDSWCDEIEREEEELQQQKRDIVEPFEASCSISAPVKETDTEADKVEELSQPKVFSYAAAAAKKASAGGEAPKILDSARMNVTKQASVPTSSDAAKSIPSKETAKQATKGKGMINSRPNSEASKNSSDKLKTERSGPRRPSRRQGSDDKPGSKPSDDTSVKKI